MQVSPPTCPHRTCGLTHLVATEGLLSLLRRRCINRRLLFESVEKPEPMSSFKDVKNGAAADIVFLVDPSWSAGKDRFLLVRQFLSDVVEALAVGDNDFHFALVRLNGNPHTEFLLNTYHTKQEVLYHILNMSYIGESNQTGEGLEYIIHSHLTEASGSRAADGVPQVIIVLTDGQSEDGFALPSVELKSVDVEVFAVGVEDADERALRELASEPLSMHVFSLENVTLLHDIVGNLVSCIHSSVNPDRAGHMESLKDITGNVFTALLLCGFQLSKNWPKAL